MGTFIQAGPERSNLRAYFVEAKGGKGPGVLPGHTWWGLPAPVGWSVNEEYVPT